MNVALDRPPAGPCAGIRVVDFSTMISGPFCTMVLGDLGADVVKVEPPRGDSMPLLGPPFQAGLSALFVPFNRNERSVVDTPTQGGEGPRVPPAGRPRPETFLPDDVWRSIPNFATRVRRPGRRRTDGS